MTARLAVTASTAAVLLALPLLAGKAQDSSGGVSSVQISSEGRAVYEEVCQACHLEGGIGGGGAAVAFPALAGNPRMADKDFLIDIMINGKGGMPWFSDLLEADQIAAVLNFIRTDFNDYPDQITAQQIAPLALAANLARGEE